jgi:hypothetical protein
MMIFGVAVQETKLFAAFAFGNNHIDNRDAFAALFK